MTIWKQDPLEVLREAFDTALFLKFRDTCKHLSRSIIVDGQSEYNQCTHPDNKSGLTFAGPAGKNKQLPGCIAGGCPIVVAMGFKLAPRLPDEDAQSLYMDFILRWYELG